jgi:alpha-1,2-mannosyltransferase
VVTLRRILLALVLAGDVFACGFLLHDRDFAYPVLWLYAIMSILFAASIRILRAGVGGRRATAWLVLGVGAALQLAALTAPPQTSDDAARYVWDAKVQLHGTDPYRYPPAATQLEPLRDSDLFGPASACTYRIRHDCTTINRPTVRTIYPPVAQAVFDATRIFSGGRGFLFPYQLIAALGAVAVSALLVRRGLQAWQVAIWAWCPVVVIEFGNNAHIDWLAALFALLSMGSAAKRHDVRAAILLAAGIATKLYPALLLPAIMKRRPLVTVAVSSAVVALTYLPHLLAVGTDIVGYLPGYLHEEGYDSGNRFLLLGRVLPHPLDTVAGVGIVLAAAIWAWRRIDDPAQAGLAVVVAALLVATPAFGWYAALLVALIALTGRWQWLPLALAPSFVYLLRLQITRDSTWLALCYLVGAAGSALLLALEKRTARKRILEPWNLPSRSRTSIWTG